METSIPLAHSGLWTCDLGPVSDLLVQTQPPEKVRNKSVEYKH